MIDTTAYARRSVLARCEDLEQASVVAAVSRRFAVAPLLNMTDDAEVHE